MKRGNVNLQNLKKFASSINRITLETRAHHKKFLFYMDEEGFHYIPESTNKPRIQEDMYIERVLVRYNKKRSFSPKDYNDLTVNASYILAVIEQYINS